MLDLELKEAIDFITKFHCPNCAKLLSSNQSLKRHMQSSLCNQTNKMVLSCTNQKRKSDELEIDCTVKQCKRYMKRRIPLYIL